MGQITADTPVGSPVIVTGWKSATLVQVDDEGTVTVQSSNGQRRTLPAADVSTPEEGTVNTHTHSTREAWLVAAVDGLRPLFATQSAEIPAVKVSVGWPGGRGKKSNVVGQCWHPEAAADKAAHIFVSPAVEQPVEVLAIMVHELVHAVDVNKSGHRGAFAKLAKSLGLTGKMTTSTPGDELKLELAKLADELGTYPHGALAAGGRGADGPKKQGTRMLKVECVEGSGYVVRMTRKWLDEFGAPTCPCHSVKMAEAV